MKRVIWWGELLAGLGLLTVGFLQDCSLTFGRPLISYVLWPTIFLAGLLCLYRVIHLKYYWEKPRLLADGGVLRMLSDLHGAEYSVWMV